MRSYSNFLRISAIAVMIFIVLVAGLASTSVQASQPAQGTPGATASGTSAAAPGATAAATLGGDEAYPPCPLLDESLAGALAGIGLPTPSGTQVATASAAPATGATPAATTAAAAPASATAAATVAAATPEPMVVGPFQEIAGCVLSATLSGNSEVPVKGDPNGKGTATLTVSRPASGPGMICFQLQVSGIKLPAAAAHIHAGPAGIPGPIVIPLAPPDASGKAEGCTSNVGRSLIKALLNYPQDYYVNVHNADYQGGADRGQLVAGS